MMVDRFRSRIARIQDHWPTQFPGLDAVILVTGSKDSFMLAEKTVLMHSWLFGAQITRTLIILQRVGQIIVWANHDTLQYFEPIRGNNCVLVQRRLPVCRQDDALNLKFIMNLVKMHAKTSLVIGMLENEIPQEGLGNLMRIVLPTLTSLTFVDCTEVILSPLVKKDEEETMLVNRSSLFACALLKKLKDRVLTVVDGQSAVTHSEVCSFGAEAINLFFSWDW